MGLYHYYRWLTSKDYRIHYWVSQHLGAHRAAWGMTHLALVMYGISYRHAAYPKTSLVDVFKALHYCVVDGRKGNRLRKILRELIEEWEAK